MLGRQVQPLFEQRVVELDDELVDDAADRLPQLAAVVRARTILLEAGDRASQRQTEAAEQPFEICQRVAVLGGR